MTIRGGGHPKQAMVLKPVSRMGPPPRSFAADAHDCIMVRSLRTYRIQGCGAMIRARWQSSPLIIVPTTTSVTAVLAPVKARPGNDGACGQGRATADLDRPCARRPQHVCGSGRRKRDSKSNKETGMEEVESGVKYMLDFKSPIQGLLGVYSRCGLHTRTVTKSRPLSRGFSHFVTSMTAPVASGWSGCRVGLAPTGKRRLFTAHTHSGQHKNRRYH